MRRPLESFHGQTRTEKMSVLICIPIVLVWFRCRSALVQFTCLLAFRKHVISKRGSGEFFTKNTGNSPPDDNRVNRHVNHDSVNPPSIGDLSKWLPRQADISSWYYQPAYLSRRTDSKRLPRPQFAIHLTALERFVSTLANVWPLREANLFLDELDERLRKSRQCLKNPQWAFYLRSRLRFVESVHRVGYFSPFTTFGLGLFRWTISLDHPVVFWTIRLFGSFSYFGRFVD